MSLIQSLLVCCAVLLAGCVLPSAAASVPLRNLGKGASSGIKEPTEEVIRNQAAWDKFWARHAGQANAPAPEIDFSKDMVIAVTLGRKTSGGYSIQISKVEAVGDRLKVSVVRTAPAPGAMTTQALTAPFHMVVVPQSDLKPEFVEVKPAAKTDR
jgi:hypothetical protein